LVEELKTRYPSRIVLFDLPPLLTAADTLAFSPYVDAALLVVEEGKTQADEAKRALGLLESTNVIGTVLNKSWTNMPDDGKVSTKLFSRLLDQARLASVVLKDKFRRRDKD
jgi:Mrp family chromosome partitioning ATPase